MSRAGLFAILLSCAFSLSAKATIKSVGPDGQPIEFGWENSSSWSWRDATDAEKKTLGVPARPRATVTLRVPKNVESVSVEQHSAKLLSPSGKITGGDTISI